MYSEAKALIRFIFDNYKLSVCIHKITNEGVSPL